MCVYKNKISVFAGILIIAAMVVTNAEVAETQTTCSTDPPYDAGSPCFAQNDDILAGQRDLLPDDDLQITARTSSLTERFTLETSDLAIATISQTQNPADCTAHPQAFAQSLIGRVFALPNDVLVNLRLDGTCGLIGLHVIDTQDSTNNSELDLNLGVSSPSKLNFAGMAMADFDKDGYQDIIFVDDKLAQVYTAKCTNDPFASCTEPPSKGLVLGPALSISTPVGPYASPPVTGDFNGDGVVDVAWPAHGTGGELFFQLVSVCPAANVKVGGTTKTCSQSMEIIPLTLSSRSGGYFDLNAIVNLTGKGVPRPYVALAAGNFDGSVDLTTGIADDELLVALTDSANKNATVTAYEISIVNGVNTVSNKSSFNFTGLQHDDNNGLQVFLAGVQLDSNSLQYQAAFSSTNNQNTHKGFVSVISFDASLTMTVKTTGLSNNAKTRIFGMAVGRFDPPDDANGNTDFDLQIAVLIDHDSKDTQVQIFSAKPANSFTPSMESLNQITSDRLFSDSFMQLAALTAGDLQGRSLVLGAPEKVTVSQTQADVILGLPPMHVDFIDPPGVTGAPQVVNVTVFPDTFNAHFDYADDDTENASHQAATSYTGAYKESVALTVKYGIPDADSVKGKFSFSATQTHNRTVTTTYDTYTDKGYSLSDQTEFDDQVSSTSKQMNIYTYPVIGQYVCPADTPNCPDDCTGGTSPCPKQPLMVQYAGPDNVSHSDPADGAKIEWYQPVSEPGNIFSYPGSFALLKLAEQSAIHLLASGGEWDSQSNNTVSITWGAGDEGSRSESTTDAFSFDAGVSVKLKEGDGVTSSSQKFSFDTNQSFSISTLNSSSQTFDATSGVKLNRGLGFVNNDIDPTDPAYGYVGQSYIYGLVQDPDSVQPNPADPDNSTNPTHGPIKLGHVADMLSMSPSTTSGVFWTQAYTGLPDLALNHPKRWEQVTAAGESGQEVKFNCPIGFTSDLTTPSSDPGSCTEDLSTTPTTTNVAASPFYMMKGLFVTPDTDNGPTTNIATLGDTLTLQARVYNYSLENMGVGTSVRVQFYAQPWGANGEFEKGSEAFGFAKAVFIGEWPDPLMDPPAQVPAFCGGSQIAFDSCTDPNAPLNWALAKVQWDTSQWPTTGPPEPTQDTYWKFWVVVWMEDSSSGNKVDEIEEHGLKDIPGMNLGSLAEVLIDTYSNNLGFYNQVFSLVLPDTGAQATPGPSAEQRQLTIEQIEIDLERLSQHTQSTVRVHHRALGARYDGVVALLYEGDPQNGGQLLDMDIVPRIAKDELFVVPFPYVPRECGPHTLFAQTLQSDGAAPVTESIDVFVKDTTAPTLSAQWAPLNVKKHGDKDKDKDKGEFRLEFSASDRCDTALQVTGVVQTPPIDGLKVKLKTKSQVKVKFDLKKGKVEIRGPNPQALLARLKEFGGLVVNNGQLVKVDLKKAKRGKQKKHEFKFKRDGTLEIEAPSAILKVTGEDASGNTAAVHVSP